MSNRVHDEIVQQRVAARRRADCRFGWYAKGAMAIALGLLVVILANIMLPGIQGLRRTELALPISAEGGTALKRIHDGINRLFPEVQERGDRRALFALLAPSIKQTQELASGETVWINASSLTDRVVKRNLDLSLPAYARGVSDRQLEWIRALQEQGRVRQVFDGHFFTAGDSRQPERASFGASIVGSLLLMAVCMAAALPVGIFAAVYLEEFARKNKLTEAIEVAINNLAAVPSIVFGLLGLSVYLLFFNLPRSSPLVGGLTLALMILPVIIIATRVSLQSVPRTIREAALGLGASPIQVVFHQVLPLALPGIMTGTILGVARAIGETAPLIMIGMVAFIADIPSAVSDPATVMPVQIYIWASSPERGFVDKTASGILVLLLILLALNAVAIYLRKRYEVKW